MRNFFWGVGLSKKLVQQDILHFKHNPDKFTISHMFFRKQLAKSHVFSE